MAAPAESKQKFCRLPCIAGLAENAAAEGDGGICAQNNVLTPARYGPCLFTGDAGAVGARKLALTGVFVDVGGQDRVGGDAKLAQQFQPPGAG